MLTQERKRFRMKSRKRFRVFAGNLKPDSGGDTSHGYN